MNHGKVVFSQLMEFVSIKKFRRCVDRYQGEHRIKSFSCWDQYLCMAFAQLTNRESLRDIETCLRTMGSKLYHIGIRGKVSRSTLARANDKRDWRIYQDFANILIEEARKLYHLEPFALALKNAVYALDSTTIDLCLTLFPWAKFRKTKAAVKMHTLLDLRGNIPSFIVISTGKMHDVKILDQIVFEAGAFYVMDRGYLDFARLHSITQCSAFFVTPIKSNTKFKRQYSAEVDKNIGVKVDQTIVLSGVTALTNYRDKIRRIKFVDPDTKKKITLLTNNFELSAKNIADLYKARWRIELFFKWIKQHLKIKTFFGTSENAVRTQIWIAISIYVLVAIVKKRLQLQQSLYTILQILSISTFHKSPISTVLSFEFIQNQPTSKYNQLNLFES
jgi:hypothetical protein